MKTKLYPSVRPQGEITPSFSQKCNFLQLDEFNNTTKDLKILESLDYSFNTATIACIKCIKMVCTLFDHKTGAVCLDNT